MKNSVVECKIYIEDCVMLNDTIWFCAYDFNALFSMNVKTKKISLCCEFPEQPYHQHRLFSAMKLIGEKIYFVPCEAGNIAIYDITTGVMELIAWPENIREKCKREYFICAQQYKEYIYMLASYSGCIIRLNTNSGEIINIDGWKEKCQHYIFDPNSMCFNKQSVIIGNVLYVPFYNANAILKLNCDTMQVVVDKLGDTQRGYCGICYDGTDVWLAQNDAYSLVKWNEDTETVNEISVMEKNKVNWYFPYTGIVHHNGKIMCAPTMPIDNLVNDEEALSVLNGEFTFIKQENGYVVYYNAAGSVLEIINQETGEELTYSLKVDIDLIDGKKLLKGIKLENSRIDLKQFIEHVKKW